MKCPLQISFFFCSKTIFGKPLPPVKEYIVTGNTKAFFAFAQDFTRMDGRQFVRFHHYERGIERKFYHPEKVRAG